MRKKIGGATAAVIGLAAAANAQVSTIGPFTGNAQEGFEAVPGYTCPPCFYACFDSTFQKNASMCDNNPGGNGMHVTPGWGFVCTIFPHGGTRLFGSAGGATNIKFTGTISKFGGYFGDNGAQLAGTATFFDEAGAQIGAPLPLTLDGCNWVWNGWESIVPIKVVRITGALYGGHILMDDMEAQVDVGCYPDCNEDGDLTVADFGCFQTEFVAGNMAYADCNKDGKLTVADFGCYQTEFVKGCPP